MEEKNDSFVVYRSFFETIKRAKMIDPLLALELYEAIFNYGLNGEKYEIDVADTNSIMIDGFLQGIYPSIDNSLARYNNAISAGGKGGKRSKVDGEELKEMLLTGQPIKEIAEYFEVTESAIRKRQEYKDFKK